VAAGDKNVPPEPEETELDQDIVDANTEALAKKLGIAPKPAPREKTAEEKLNEAADEALKRLKEGGTPQFERETPAGSGHTLSPLELRALRKGIPPWIERAESAGAAINLLEVESRDRIAAAVADEAAAGRLGRTGLQRILVGRYGEGARVHAPEIWKQVAQELKRSNGPEGPIAREFRHNEQGATDWLLSRGSGEVPGALHDPALGNVDLTYGFSSQTARPETGPQGLDHIATDHPEALPHLQEILDGEMTRSAIR